MVLFPESPLPSHISAPALLDPVHRFAVDQGYELRRSKHSRPRRQFVAEYLGKRTDEMRTIRDFVASVRGGALAFEWIHTTAYDIATVDNTTPILLTYAFPHGYLTGQWMWVTNFPALGTPRWQVTRLSATQLLLNGTIALGVTACSTNVYLPEAKLVVAQDTWESPQKLRGPEQGADGYFNFTVMIEELF